MARTGKWHGSNFLGPLQGARLPIKLHLHPEKIRSAVESLHIANPCWLLMISSWGKFPSIILKNTLAKCLAYLNCSNWFPKPTRPTQQWLPVIPPKHLRPPTHPITCWLILVNSVKPFGAPQRSCNPMDPRYRLGGQTKLWGWRQGFQSILEVVISAKKSMDGFILCREVVKFKIRESLRTDPAGQMQKRLTVWNAWVFFQKRYIQNWDLDPSTATWISILIIEGIDIL